jgi:hypothetical protein
VNERDEKLTDIPELQNTILESPEGWDMMDLELPVGLHMMEDNYASFDFVPAVPPLAQYSAEYAPASFGEASPECSGMDFAPLICERSFASRMQPSIADDIDTLFIKIKECEKLIEQNVDYQAFLDEIIDELRPHFSSPSKEYKKLFKKMKKETPKVYALIEPYLK